MSLLVSILLTLFLQPAPKTLLYEDKTYEKEIKTVQLYRANREVQSNLLPAVTQLSQHDLVLEFDDLRTDINRYYARVIHCRYNWVPSQLRDLDFMTDYNEFNISDYAYSSNTLIPYVHYRFTLPMVKLPGNYLLVVYRDGHKSDIVLSHRFMVTDNKVSLKHDNQNAGALTLRSANQQMNFILDYNGFEILNPFENVHVVIRQNQRWDNAKFDVKPSFVREDIRQIEYRLFGDDKYFEAGNEFRFVDFRSVNFPGQNTDRIDKKSNPFHLWVQEDVPKDAQAYAQYLDLNGQFNIENLDNGNPETASNYLDVTLTLKATELSNAKVYALGAFNSWIKDDNSEMKFDSEHSVYSNTILLKQGWYNYQYQVDGKNLSPFYFEGSHFETENFYEIMVYYKPFQPNTELLIGYFPISINSR